MKPTCPSCGAKDAHEKTSTAVRVWFRCNDCGHVWRGSMLAFAYQGSPLGTGKAEPSQATPLPEFTSTVVSSSSDDFDRGLDAVEASMEARQPSVAAKETPVGSPLDAVQEIDDVDTAAPAEPSEAPAEPTVTEQPRPTETVDGWLSTAGHAPSATAMPPATGNVEEWIDDVDPVPAAAPPVRDLVVAEIPDVPDVPVAVAKAKPEPEPSHDMEEDLAAFAADAAPVADVAEDEPVVEDELVADEPDPTPVPGRSRITDMVMHLTVLDVHLDNVKKRLDDSEQRYATVVQRWQPFPVAADEPHTADEPHAAAS